MGDRPERTTSETPWGLSWKALLSSLRPTPAELSHLDGIVKVIHDALKTADINLARLEVGGDHGTGTMMSGSSSLQLYAIFNSFNPYDYFQTHLQPLTDAISEIHPRPSSITQRGLSVTGVIDDVPFSLFACTDLYVGPAQLATIPSTPSVSSPTDARNVHLQTSCSVLRSSMLRTQPLLYKDMVRVAQKWISTTDIVSDMDKPSSYLLQLLMLAAVRSAPVQHPSPELYDNIMRKFYTLIGTSCLSGEGIVADASMSSMFLWWPFFYDRHVVDWCISISLLQSCERESSCPLIIVDIAAPFVNVARSLPNWSELRRVAREAMVMFEKKDVIQTLEDRMQSITDRFKDSVDMLQNQLTELQVIEEAPRRWTGIIQFTESHMNSDKWTSVIEVTLRNCVWRVNVRRSRTEGIGYSTMVDLSLQKLGVPLTRTLDVDVTFRTTTSYLAFDEDNDHAFLQKRSEVIRSRDYPLQITVIA